MNRKEFDNIFLTPNSRKRGNEEHKQYQYNLEKKNELFQQKILRRKKFRFEMWWWDDNLELSLSDAPRQKQSPRLFLIIINGYPSETRPQYLVLCLELSAWMPCRYLNKTHRESSLIGAASYSAEVWILSLGEKYQISLQLTVNIMSLSVNDGTGRREGINNSNFASRDNFCKQNNFQGIVFWSKLSLIAL